MRLPTLLVIATVGVTAGQVPVSQTQPRRDAVRRAEPTGTARIKGRVVSADRGAPMRRANVSLALVIPPGAMRGAAPDGNTGRAGQPGPMTPRRATTDSDGQFEFAGLPAGSYRVTASPAQYSSQYLSMSYGARGPSGPFWPEPGQSIQVSDGQVVDKVVIALPRGAIITGRVIDENGDPLARVQVYTLGFPPGATRGQRFGGGIQTDDLGQFRIWGLGAGEYVVVADARMNTFAPPNAPPETEEDRVGYVTTYYPGTIDESSAQRVRVKAGEETQGIDIRVGQARMYHISGSVIDSKGNPVAGGNGQLMRRGSFASASPLFASTDAKGQFLMRNVPPGDYRFIFRPPQNNVVPFSDDRNREPVEMAIVPISIGNADVDNMTVVTSLGVTISGHIVYEQGPPAAPASSSTMRVMAVMLNPDDTAGIPSPPPATIAEDASFTLKGLMGEYGLRVAVPNQYMKSVTVNGQDITDVPHEFKSSDRVTITVTSRVSTLEGNVTDIGDAQMTDAGIILFADDKSSWRFTSFWTRRTGVEPNGHFRITGLMPGKYYAAAIPRQRLTLQGGPEAATAFFEQLAKEATSIVIGADEQRTIDLRLLDAFARQ